MEINKALELGLEWAEKRMASELTEMDKEYILTGIIASLVKNCSIPDFVERSEQSPYSIYEEELNKMKQLPQTQTSLMKQREVLRIFANKLGLYDAADFLRNDR